MNVEVIQLRLEEHDEKIEQNTKDINKLKTDAQEDRIKQAEMYVKLDNLVESVKGLTSVMKWFLCLAGSSLLGFFIWTIQNRLF